MKSTQKPVVAIIGRPNVGKSTLFNRLVGGHRAITADISGVTRDRHYGPVSWDGRDFLLIDTAGFVAGARDELEEKTQEQVQFSIEEADTILFLVDGRVGLLPEEREISDRLRRSGKRFLIVVNKVDTVKQKEGRLADFYSLGDEPSAISAEDSLGVNDLLDRVVAPWPAETSEEKEADKVIKVAIIGRPNVGKSSLLNRLLGQERVVVHHEAGTTRDVVDTPVTVGSQEFLLLDTAGIRRKGRWASKVESASVLAALKAIDRADCCLLLLDAAEGLNKQDAHIAGTCYEAKKELILLWNKSDLATGPFQKYEELIKDRFKFLSFAPLLFCSAKSGKGCEAIWPSVMELHENAGRRTATSEVNRVLEQALASHNPPSFRGHPIKFSYATQIATFPPTFIIFTNAPQGVPESFKRHLEHFFREALDFTGTPLQLFFRKKN